MHDWPSEDVPNALVRAGLDATFQGGPAPDDLYVMRLVDGRPETRPADGLPDHADIIYSHRPAAGLPRLLDEARRLGACTLWHQSGLDERGEKDPAGVHLTEAEAEQMTALARGGHRLRQRPVHRRRRNSSAPTLSPCRGPGPAAGAGPAAYGSA